MKNVVFTSCNLAYLDRAVVLAKTVKKYASVDFVLLLSDYADDSYFASAVFSFFDIVIDISQIGIHDFTRWSFQYDVIELCTAVKGFCFQYLFNEGYDKVIYLDPDIACYSALDFLFKLLDEHSILLTPHQLFPAKTALEVKDNELCSHKHGIFNLGFLGLSSSEQGIEFANWWSARLREYCLDDIPNGMFTDQKWCDAVPSYFTSYHIIRHPGCNVASWNLCERRLTIKDGLAYVNNEHPLVFYHYTKYFSDGVAMTKRYAQTVDSIDIWNWYNVLITEARLLAGKPKRSNKYGLYRDGTPIRPIERREYRLKFNQGLINIGCDPYESAISIY